MGIAAFFASLAFLLLRLAPSINWKDSGELVSGAHLLTPAHFPGYPLYVLLAKPFLLIPAGSMATRAALANVVCAAAIIGLLAWTARRSPLATRDGSLATRHSPLATIIAVLLATLLALSPIFLEEATISENTMPFLLLLGLAFIPTLRPHDLTGSRDHGITASRLHGPTGSRPHDPTGSRVHGFTGSRFMPLVALMLSYHPFLAFAGGTLVIALLILVERGRTAPLGRSTLIFATCLLLFSSAHILSFARTGRTVALTDASVGSWSEFRSTMQYHLGRWGVAQKSGQEDAPFGCVQVWAESAVLEGHASPSVAATAEDGPSGPESDPARGGVPPRIADRGEGRTPKFIPRFKLDLLVKEFPLFLFPFWLVGFWVQLRRRSFEGALHGLFFLMFFFIYFSQYGQELRGLALPLFLYATGWTYLAFHALLKMPRRTVSAGNEKSSCPPRAEPQATTSIVTPAKAGVQSVLDSHLRGNDGERDVPVIFSRALAGITGLIILGLALWALNRIPPPAWGWDQYALGSWILEGLDPRAVWLTSNPRFVSMAYYTQYVEQSRPDVDLVVEFSPAHTTHWQHTETRVGLVAGLGGDLNPRVESIVALVGQSRPVYRDTPLSEIHWSRFPQSSVNIHEMLGAMKVARANDFWGLAMLMFQSVDLEGLNGAYEVSNPTPETRLSACGMLYRSSPTGDSCGRLGWPRDQEKQTPLNREVLGYLWLNRGHYHLALDELEEAVESFRTLVRLHPVTTR